MTELEGTWFGEGLEPMGGPPVSARMTIMSDGSFESLLFDPAGELVQMSMRGYILRCDGVLAGESREAYMPPEGWVPYYMVFESFFDFFGNRFLLYQDFDQDGITDAVWELFRM